MPVVVQRQVSMVQKIQRTIEVALARRHRRKLWRWSRSERFLQNPHHPCSSQHPSWKLLQLLLSTQRTVPTDDAVQKTVDVPQIQHIENIVNVPVVSQRHALTIQTETVEVPPKSVSSSSGRRASCDTAEDMFLFPA